MKLVVIHSYWQQKDDFIPAGNGCILGNQEAEK